MCSWLAWFSTITVALTHLRSPCPPLIKGPVSCSQPERERVWSNSHRQLVLQVHLISTVLIRWKWVTRLTPHCHFDDGNDIHYCHPQSTLQINIFDQTLPRKGERVWAPKNNPYTQKPKYYRFEIALALTLAECAM